MKEFIEKLNGKLEEEIKKINDEPWLDCEERIKKQCIYCKTIKIVNELAEECKEPLTTDETQEIRTIMKQMRELFEEAWDLNNYGEGTDLSKMVTTYLPQIEQSYKYFVERAVK